VLLVLVWKNAVKLACVCVRVGVPRR